MITITRLGNKAIKNLSKGKARNGLRVLPVLLDELHNSTNFQVVLPEELKDDVRLSRSMWFDGLTDLTEYGIITKVDTQTYIVNGALFIKK